MGREVLCPSEYVEYLTSEEFLQSVRVILRAKEILWSHTSQNERRPTTRQEKSKVTALFVVPGSYLLSRGLRGQGRHGLSARNIQLAEKR